RFYGEGSQMLTQTGGTLARPVALGGYTDPKHYRLPQPEGATTGYTLMTLSPSGGAHLLLAFPSSRRFIAKFHVRPASVEAVVDLEGKRLAPGETWELEEFLFARGPHRSDLLATLSDRIAHHHPPLRFPTVPAGWCSWYCFGPRVTARHVIDNLDFIARNVP